MPPAAPKKGKGPLFWILIAGGAIVLIGIVMVGLAGYAVSRVASNIGFSMDDLKNNPGLTAARLAIAANPDLEMLDVDEDTSTIRVRNTKTGEETSMRLDPEAGELVVVDGEGNQSTINFRGQGDNAQVQINSNGTSASYGLSTGGSLPSWLPAYPGTEPQSNMHVDTPEGVSDTFTFQTSDAAGDVLDFYADALEGAGLEVPTRVSQGAGGMLIAGDTDQRRQVVVTVSDSGQVGMQVSEKK